MSVALRIGRECAECRQDIVLSGQNIMEEHCIFRSESAHIGEGTLIKLHDVRMENGILQSSFSGDRNRGGFSLLMHSGCDSGTM